MTKVLYPGSFDPVHNGHLGVIETAARLFDTVVVAAMRNPQKNSPFFTDDERRDMISETVAHLDNVEVVMFGGLVVDLAAELEVTMIVKGLRTVSDFESEMQMAQMNQAVTGIDTGFLPATTADGFIASKYIRDITKLGGDVTHLVPEPVARRLRERIGS